MKSLALVAIVGSVTAIQLNPNNVGQAGGWGWYTPGANNANPPVNRSIDDWYDNKYKRMQYA